MSCALGEESAILNMKNSVYYGMNAVGTRVWNLLQQPKTVRASFAMQSSTNMMSSRNSASAICFSCLSK